MENYGKQAKWGKTDGKKLDFKRGNGLKSVLKIQTGQQAGLQGCDKRNAKSDETNNDYKLTIQLTCKLL